MVYFLHSKRHKKHKRKVVKYMTDAQKQRLADLQATETLAEEEKPVLDALLTLQAADQALTDAQATVPVTDPVAIAQKGVDDALAAYEAAEATFQATQNPPAAPAV